MRWGFALLSATLVAGWLFSRTALVRPRLAVGSQGGVLGAGLGHLCRAAAGARARLARPQRRRVLYAGAMLLLLAYVGSRFVLEVVLGRTT